MYRHENQIGQTLRDRRKTLFLLATKPRGLVPAPPSFPRTSAPSAFPSPEEELWWPFLTRSSLSSSPRPDRLRLAIQSLSREAGRRTVNIEFARDVTSKGVIPWLSKSWTQYELTTQMKAARRTQPKPLSFLGSHHGGRAATEG